jgi:hypothetical protein
MKKALVCTMLLGVVWSLPAAADDGGLKFNGGIGVHPISTIAGCPGNVTPPQPCLTDPGSDTVTPSPTSPTVSFNIVRGVHPAGQIWVINDLKATVKSGGSIKVNGKGLVLGGGNNAGRAPTPALSVIATLICEAAAPFTEHTSSLAGVLLSPTGDFQINDTLAPPPPAACASPMLLIRNAATAAGPPPGFPNPWFAVGIYNPNGSGDD